MPHNFTELRVTNNRVQSLMADFSGLENLENIVNAVIERLWTSGRIQTSKGFVRSGAMSIQDFDGEFSELLRKELGKVLGIARARAVRKASASGAGSAASAVKRRMYKDGYAGNINIAQESKRISSRRRVVPDPAGGESGIRRTRTVKGRTKKLREYFGPDRSFILRILESGRDVYMATSDGPTGRKSKATYGRRGAISPRGFFHTMGSDMEQAAQQLGQTLINHVETWIEKKFKEE